MQNTYVDMRAEDVDDGATGFRSINKHQMRINAPHGTYYYYTYIYNIGASCLVAWYSSQLNFGPTGKSE